MRQPCVYILASRRNGTLYIGMTVDLHSRMDTHQSGAVKGFTQKHNVKMLVHVEYYGTTAEAREREWRMKKWRRAWKLRLIEENNPDWRDLSKTWL